MTSVPEHLPFPAFVAAADGELLAVNAPWQTQLAPGVGDRWPDSFMTADDSAMLQLGITGKYDTPRRRIKTDTRDGSIRWFEVYLEQLQQGAADQFLGIFIDVTGQVRREAELSSIIHTAVDGVIIIDEHGRIENVNESAEEMFGYSAAELAGQPITMLMPEPHRSQHDTYLTRYLETGATRVIGTGRDLEAITRDGRSIPIHLTVSEIRIEGTHRFTGFVRDLSEQHATLQALAEHRERLAHVGRLSIMGEMTASIAHEINQPLTAMAMYAQSSLKLLKREAPDLEKLSSALDKLNTQCLRAGAIIERIQRFTRGQEHQREPVEINLLLRDLIKLADGDARLNNAELRFEYAAGLPIVMADPIQIQQVALNLIRNAIDAMQEIGCIYGRQVVIATRQVSDALIEVSVTDQGPGVTDADLLFTPFHTTKKEGMGMGLSICKTIIAEHNGVMGFRPRSDHGPGAVFFFTLPTGSMNDE